MVWVATRSGLSWYHLDEWVVIGRTTGSHDWISSAFAGFQGHLIVGSYVLYRLQRSWLGLESNQLVYLAFCVSLGALQLSVAAVLRRLGLPTMVALLAATVIAFFGPGAQNMVWEFQLSSNFALALCFVACFIALRDEAATSTTAMAVAGLLLAAIGTDSGFAAFGVAYVGVVVVLLWPRRLSSLVLGPVAVAYTVWLAVGDLGTTLTTSFGAMASFAYHLVTLAAGGLVGGGDTHSAVAYALGGPQVSEAAIPVSGEVVGIVTLLVASSCVAVGLFQRRLSRKAIASLIGGLVSAVLAVAVFARTRAWIVDPAQLPGSRYVQLVAVFLLVAFAPALAATLRPAAPRSRRSITVVACVFLMAVFALNLNQVGPIRHFEENFGQAAKSRVREAVTVLSKGCRKGSQPDPHVSLGVNSKITVGLLQELIAHGDLTPSFGAPAGATMYDNICRPSRSLPARRVQ